jgi:hypothetical protein
MTKTLRSLILSMGLLIFGATLVQAGEIKWQKSPIQTHWAFGGMEYSLAGQKLGNFQDFADTLEPINDPRANRLLADSQNNALIGTIGSLVGSLGIGWGGGNLLFNDSPSLRSAHVAVLLTGVGIDLLAALFLDDSRAQKYNAVQRYNEVVRGEDPSLPAAPADDKSLLPSTKNP